MWSVLCPIQGAAEASSADAPACSEASLRTLLVACSSVAAECSLAQEVPVGTTIAVPLLFQQKLDAFLLALDTHFRHQRTPERLPLRLNSTKEIPAFAREIVYIALGTLGLLSPFQRLQKRLLTTLIAATSRADLGILRTYFSGLGRQQMIPSTLAVATSHGGS